MRNSCAAILAIVLAASSDSTFAQGLSESLTHDIRRSISNYNDCVASQFDSKTLSDNEPSFGRSIVKDVIASCEDTLVPVRATLLRVPGAKIEKVEGRVERLRASARMELLAAIMLVLAWIETNER